MEEKLKLPNVTLVAMTSVNVKATTEEQLGFTGTGEGMRCHAVCLLEE